MWGICKSLDFLEWPKHNITFKWFKKKKKENKCSQYIAYSTQSYISSYFTSIHTVQTIISIIQSKDFPRNLLSWLSLMSFHHWHLVGLACLNHDKIYMPAQENGQEYGNTIQQKHCRPLGHWKDLLFARPFC